MDKGQQFQLVDVREPYEYEIANLGGVLIPLGNLEERLGEITSSEMVIVHCRSGARSARAIEKLTRLGFKNIFNLKGGILEWSDKIDPGIPKY